MEITILNLLFILSDEKIDYFAKPKACDLALFFQKHPMQESRDPVIRKTFHRVDGSQRVWLSFNQEKKALYCSVCLAFSKKHDCLFVTGFNNRKHMHQRIDEHEVSGIHKECSSTLLSIKSDFSVTRMIQKDYIIRKMRTS